MDICKQCGSKEFQTISNITYETLERRLSVIIQCKQCGRYKFFDQKNLELKDK